MCTVITVHDMIVLLVHAMAASGRQPSKKVTRKSLEQRGVGYFYAKFPTSMYI